MSQVVEGDSKVDIATMQFISNNQNIYSIAAEDSNNVINCMKYADNIHDFCKGRSDISFNEIENGLISEQYIIKTSPSTIEEMTSKQLTINTGLYNKIGPKKTHSPIEYSSLDSHKIVLNLLDRKDDIAYITIKNDDEKLEDYLKFVKNVYDVNLNIPSMKNLDGKRVFAEKQRIYSKKIICDFFKNRHHLNDFSFILDASNISLKKVFYTSTTNSEPQGFTHNSEETNKWDMASNVLPPLEATHSNIPLLPINTIIMYPVSQDNITSNVSSYNIDIQNIEFLKIRLIDSVPWESILFKKLIDVNDNYFYLTIDAGKYEILLNDEFASVLPNYSFLKSIPILSGEINCYPVHLHNSNNSKLYGVLVFQHQITNNAVIIVSRAYRTSLGDSLGVNFLSAEIKKNLSDNVTSGSINEIITHLNSHIFKSKLKPNVKKDILLRFLLDIKRIGDWGQIYQCYNNNNFIYFLEQIKEKITEIDPRRVLIERLLQKYNTLIFISVDNLAICMSQLLNINFIHTKKNDNEVTFIMHRTTIPATATPEQDFEYIEKKSTKLNEQFNIHLNMTFFDECLKMLNYYKTNILNEILNFENVMKMYNLTTHQDQEVHEKFPYIVIYVTQFIYSIIRYLVYQHMRAVANYQLLDSHVEEKIQNFKKKLVTFTFLDDNEKKQIIIDLKRCLVEKQTLLNDIFVISNNLNYNSSDIAIFNSLFQTLPSKKEPLLNKFRTILKKTNVFHGAFDYGMAFIKLIDIIDLIAKIKLSKFRKDYNDYRKNITILLNNIGNVYKNLNIIKLVDKVSIQKYNTDELKLVDIVHLESGMKNTPKYSGFEQMSRDEQLEQMKDSNFIDINITNFVSDKLIKKQFEKMGKEILPDELITDLIKYIQDIILINYYSSDSKIEINGNHYDLGLIENTKYIDKDKNETLLFNIDEFISYFKEKYSENLINIMQGGFKQTYRITTDRKLATTDIINIRQKNKIYQPKTKIGEKIVSLIKKFITNINNDINIGEFNFSLNMQTINNMLFEESRLSVYITRGTKQLKYKNSRADIIDINYIKIVLQYYLLVFIPTILKFKNNIRKIAEQNTIGGHFVLSLFNINKLFNTIISQHVELKKHGLNKDIIFDLENIDDKLFDDDIVSNNIFLDIYDLNFLNHIMIANTTDIIPEFEEKCTVDDAYDLFLQLAEFKTRDQSLITMFANKSHVHIIVFLRMIQIIKINKIVTTDDEIQHINDRMRVILEAYNYTDDYITMTIEEINKNENLLRSISDWDTINIYTAFAVDFGIILPSIVDLDDELFKNMIYELCIVSLKNYKTYKENISIMLTDENLNEMLPEFRETISKHGIDVDSIISNSNKYRSGIINLSQLAIHWSEQGGSIDINDIVKKKYTGGLIVDEDREDKENKDEKVMKNNDFITHVNFIEIYTELKYLYNNYSKDNFFNFKALCHYYNIIIPVSYKSGIKQLIYYINSQFIQRYFIKRQELIFNTIFKNIDKCDFNRFFEYLSLYVEIKKYANIVKKIEINISSIESVEDDAFLENVEQLYITAESLDYYIERPIYSLYGEISILKCVDTQTFQNIIDDYKLYNWKKYEKKLHNLYKYGIKSSDIDNIIYEKPMGQIHQNELQINLNLFERFIHDYEKSKLL